MYGAIAGDIIGSVYEHGKFKSKEFQLFAPDSRFTDDTVLSVALADTILSGTPYVKNLKIYFDYYPNRGYGGGFRAWALSQDSKPYNSFGNGAAMRISPVGFAYDSLEQVLQKAKEFTEVTHNHPEGIKGAQATAAAIFLARQKKPMTEIKQYIEQTFQYDLSRHIDEIRPSYKFDTSCQGTVPHAIRAFLDSTGFEDAIRNAISIGGDADTIACITGGIAEAYYGVPNEIREEVFECLDDRLDIVASRFSKKFCE